MTINKKRAVYQTNSCNYDRFIDDIVNCVLINIAVPIIDLLCPQNPDAKYRKYSNREYFIEILMVLKTNNNWSGHMGRIKWKTLHAKHMQFLKKGIYEEINRAILIKYLGEDFTEKLKYQIIDSCSITNKGCHELIAFNSSKGKKRYIKLSTITDCFGGILGIALFSGNTNDCITLIETLNSIPVDTKSLEYANNNRYKQYMLGDAGYSSEENVNELKERGLTPLIYFNKRNNKNKKYIESKKFNKKQQKIYRKRVTIERSFSWIKNFPKINNVYEKKASSFLGLVYLAASHILLSKLIGV